MTDWSERIPAAIATGEEHVNSAGHRGNAIAMRGAKCKYGITAGEVALAKAVWDTQRAFSAHVGHGGEVIPDPALIAYCEKIERLSHD